MATVFGVLLFLINIKREYHLITRHRVWGLCYFLMIYTFLPADDRYFLPLVPLFVLVVTRGFLSFRFAVIGVILIILVNFYFSFKMAHELHTEYAPPERAVQHIEEQYKPGTTMLFCRSIRRHARYYLSSEWIIKDSFTHEDLMNAVVNGYHVITDITPNTLFSEEQLEKLAITRLRTFKRDEILHHKHNRIRLYHITRKDGPF